MQARIANVAYYLPKQELGNEELARLYTGWTPESIEAKLGVHTRHIAAADETAADMAISAARNLFDRGVCRAEDVDFLILCTQTPDHFLPTSACLIQDQLGLSRSIGAFDFNLGCSGFVYGLAIAKGLIETGAATNILLLTSDTYSKYINPLDRTTRPLFGDAAAATLIRGVEVETGTPDSIGPFVFGTDGAGGDLLTVPAGGHRMPRSEETAIEQPDGKGGMRSQNDLYMHGQGVFSFAVEEVPAMVDALLRKSGVQKQDIDLFVFHQANKFMLQKLRSQCDIDPDRFVIDMADKGNTVASTIPIALLDTYNRGSVPPGARAMLAGFGVGLSWAATLVALPETL